MRLILALAVVVAGCAIGEPPAEPQRFVIEGDDVEVTPSQLVFPIETHPEFATALSGDLVAGVQGGGYVRRVVAIERGGGDYAVATEDITLGEAVGDAEIQSSLNDGKGDGTTDVVFDFERTGIKLFEEAGVSIEIAHGKLAFRPRLDVDLEFGNWRLEHFLINARGQLDGDVTVAVRAPQAGDWKLSREVWSGSKTFVQWFGWVPVVETVELAIGVGADVATTGTAEARVHGGFTGVLGGGVEYVDGGWRTLKTTEVQARGTPPQVTASGTVAVDAYVFAELRVWMYGTAGPFVKIRPGLRLRGDETGIARTVGVRGDGGAELSNPFGEDLRYEAKLFDVSSQPF